MNQIEKDSPQSESNPFENFSSQEDVEYFLRCLARVTNLSYDLCVSCEKAADYLANQETFEDGYRLGRYEA